MKKSCITPLKYGYTTGACAAAAAKGAMLMLLGQENVGDVAIDLPAGFEATFQLEKRSFGRERASCSVIKDAGDDPDVTDKAEIHADVAIIGQRCVRDGIAGNDRRIVITGGAGIGIITRPGLALPPGEHAINPVPRMMIESELLRTLENASPFFDNCRFLVELSIPDGEARARKTLNSRLGIKGGLSILGTTGIVTPLSAKAWTDTIDVSIDVASAAGSGTVILSTGRTSEVAAQKFLTDRSISLPFPSFRKFGDEAFIMMGDHLAHAVKSAAERGFSNPLIACQFAKLLKIACGYQNTHAAASRIDLSRLLEWGEEANIDPAIAEIISNANTAREIAVACNFSVDLIDLVSRHAVSAIKSHADGTEPLFLVADYGGEIIRIFPPAEHWKVRNKEARQILSPAKS